jgi:hypothetical protein
MQMNGTDTTEASATVGSTGPARLARIGLTTRRGPGASRMWGCFGKNRSGRREPVDLFDRETGGLIAVRYSAGVTAAARTRP